VQSSLLWTDSSAESKQEKELDRRLDLFGGRIDSAESRLTDLESTMTDLFFSFFNGFLFPLQIYPHGVHIVRLLLTTINSRVYTIAGHHRAMGQRDVSSAPSSCCVTNSTDVFINCPNDVW